MTLLPPATTCDAKTNNRDDNDDTSCKHYSKHDIEHSQKEQLSLLHCHFNSLMNYLLNYDIDKRGKKQNNHIDGLHCATIATNNNDLSLSGNNNNHSNKKNDTSACTRNSMIKQKENIAKNAHGKSTLDWHRLHLQENLARSTI